MEATRKALSLSEMEVWKQIGTLCQGPYSPPNQTWQKLKLAVSFDQVAFPCLSYILLITFRWPIINFPLLASHASLIWMCCILSHYISKNRADMTLTFDCGWHNMIFYWGMICGGGGNNRQQWEFFLGHREL